MTGGGICADRTVGKSQAAGHNFDKFFIRQDWAGAAAGAI